MSNTATAAVRTRTVDVCQVCGCDVADISEGCEDHPGAPVLAVECLSAADLLGLPPKKPGSFVPTF